MKDPCDECLVKVTCAEVCEKKDSYTTILKHALSQYRNIMMRPLISSYLKKYNKYYNYYSELYNKNLISMQKIKLRSNLF